MPRDFTLGDRAFGPGRVLVIAEIGTGHGGDIGKAAELCAAAAEAGADCAKFQCVLAREIIHPRTGLVPLPGGVTELFESFLALEKGEDFYAAAKKAAEACGLLFLCTPFGLGSARLLRRLGVGAMKVASPELNHLPLLDELASYGLPCILSSGVSTLADIERALARFEEPAAGASMTGGRRGLALLHCVTSYPAPEEDYNLGILRGYSSLFGIPVGVSDHSLDPILVPALSVAAGGVIVEKHICLSREEKGLDDPIALPPRQFAAMVAAVRAAQSDPPGTTMDSLEAAYGRGQVLAVMGDGVKRLAPSERANYGRTNRSVHALRDIVAGSVLARGDLALLRTEKVLRPGLAPELLERVVGRVARRDVPSGEGIEWEDLGDLA